MCIRDSYDAYHMQLNEGSLCDTIRASGDQFGHVHVADAPGRHEPGTGEINYRAVFACLEEIGYEGMIGFEPVSYTHLEVYKRQVQPLCRPPRLEGRAGRGRQQRDRRHQGEHAAHPGDERVPPAQV